MRADSSTRPPVLVTIVVDQLAAWVADERMDQLPKTGGFARLAREGTRVRELRYAHAVTDTAPGHSALYTGAIPRESGIFGNEVIDEKAGKRVSILLDPRVQAVRTTGPVPNSRGSSAARLRVPTVADQLRAARPDAFIVSLSLKDRGAIFGGGSTPTASIWYDAGTSDWVSSTAFARELPGWVPPPRRMVSSQFQSFVWDPLDPAWVKAHAKTPDDQPGEGDLAGLGTTFPHRLGAARAPALAFRATPFADEALLGLALAALDDPRAKGHAIMLAISLSANDYIGHTFGPDSWEAWDELLRLDASLARFFATLDARFTEKGYAVILSADHGVVSMPEAIKGCPAGARPDPWQRPCEGGTRLLPDALAEDLQAEAAKAIGPGRWIAGVADPYVYFTAAAQALDSKRRADLTEALRRWLSARSGVHSVYVTREIAGRTCAPNSDESEEALVCRSVVPFGGGELFIDTVPGTFFDPSVVVGKGTSHGTPYRYDRSVPLFARAPGRVAAGADIREPMGFGTFARTASSLLGIEAPAAVKAASDLTVPTSPR